MQNYSTWLIMTMTEKPKSHVNKHDWSMAVVKKVFFQQWGKNIMRFLINFNYVIKKDFWYVLKTKLFSNVCVFVLDDINMGYISVSGNCHNPHVWCNRFEIEHLFFMFWRKGKQKGNSSICYILNKFDIDILSWINYFELNLLGICHST